MPWSCCSSWRFKRRRGGAGSMTPAAGVGRARRRDVSPRGPRRVGRTFPTGCGGSSEGFGSSTEGAEREPGGPTRPDGMSSLPGGGGTQGDGERRNTLGQGRVAAPRPRFRLVTNVLGVRCRSRIRKRRGISCSDSSTPNPRREVASRPASTYPSSGAGANVSDSYVEEQAVYAFARLLAVACRKSYRPVYRKSTYFHTIRCNPKQKTRPGFSSV